VHDSRAHENYTRRWANEVSVPVFSVDYRLSPETPYPGAINDCYQAYVWIVTHAKEQLGMDIKHFILCGDSAGGHLVTSVSLLAGLRGFRKPDAIMPIYPVYSCDIT
jgi:hormone-sensitive lipase